MALANYVKTCAKNVSGNKYEVYIAPSGTVTALAETTGEISTLTAAATSFKKIQADLDTVQYTHEGTFKTSGAYTQNLIMKFSKASTELNTLIDELVSGVACGFEVIWVDANAKVWLAGVSIDTKEGSYRPWNQLTSSYDSGVALTDEDVQADTITLTRVSAYRPVELDNTLSAAVIDGTAAYIDF